MSATNATTFFPVTKDPDFRQVLVTHLTNDWELSAGIRTAAHVTTYIRRKWSTSWYKLQAWQGIIVYEGKQYTILCNPITLQLLAHTPDSVLAANNWQVDLSFRYSEIFGGYVLVKIA